MRRSVGRVAAQIQNGVAGLEGVFQSHQEFFLLLILFLSLRLSLLVISRPQGILLDGSDYDFYLQFGQMADRGLYPDIQYWTEYPPVFPWIAVGAYRAVEILPTLGGSPLFWFRLVLGSVLLLFDVGNLVLIYWLASTLRGQASGIRTAWIYALLFTPLHVWLGWFDTMPLFFLLLAVALGVKGKHSAAALVSGFGFMVKVFPILVLPALVKVEPRFRHRAKLVTLAAIAVGLVATPFLLLGAQYLIASFRSLTARSPWETVWAVAEGYYGYGWVAPLQDRVDPSTASYTAYHSHLPWLPISIAFAALYLLLWTRRVDLRQPSKMVAFTGLTLNLFFFYSRGYSPQFLVYLVPFALLVLPQFRAIGYLIVLSAINLVEYPVYLILFKDQGWLLRDLVLMRAAILVLLSWEYLTALELVPSLEAARKVAVSGTMLAFVTWGVISLPAAGQTWARSAEQHDPNAAVIQYLVANAGPRSVVVFTNEGLYRALYPYLYQKTNLLLVDPASDSRIASLYGAGQPLPHNGTTLSSKMGQLSSSYDQIFGVRQMSDMGGRQMEQMLSSGNRLTDTRYLSDLDVTEWSTGH